MSIEEKDELEVISMKLKDVSSTLKIIRSELLNPNGAFNSNVIAGGLNVVINSIESINNDLNKE